LMQPRWSRARLLGLVVAAISLAACGGSDEEETPDTGGSDASADALGDVGPGADVGDEEVVEPDSALPDIVEPDVAPDVTPDTVVEPDVADVAEPDIVETDVQPDTADADVEPDIVEPMPSSCSTVSVQGESVQRIEAEADADGLLVAAGLYIDDELRTDVIWEYDEFGRETLGRETQYGQEGVTLSVRQQRYEWTEATPSQAGTYWRENDSDNDGVWDSQRESVVDANGNQIQYREFTDGALSYEVRDLIIADQSYSVYQDFSGEGTSSISHELVGELPTPSRLVTTSDGVARHSDFTWDSEGRVLERSEDYRADGTIEERAVWSYPAAGVSEEIFSANESAIANYFSRRVRSGDRLLGDYNLYPGDCSIYVVEYSAEDANEYQIRSGGYTTPSSDCLAVNREFPETNYRTISTRDITRCGETMYRVDADGDGTFENTVEVEYDDECWLLSEHVKDGSPGFEERALRRQGVPTYNAEGWLTSLIIASFSEFYTSDEVTQTWDERGNLLSQVRTTPTGETTFTRVATTFTWDSADRQLTRQEVYSSDVEETYRTDVTYTYEGDWPDTKCLDRLPSESEG
jgi:hypothetical protein